MTLRKSNKLIFGVGINDADYNVYQYVYVGGKRKLSWYCPFYVKWRSMIERCYSLRCQIKHPTYIGCIVCYEWLTFSAFKAWMEQQDWEGKELDKDILFPENKVYSADTCVFVDQRVNLFSIESDASRGDWPIGVYWHKTAGKFSSQCQSVITGRRTYLGLFDTPEEAHKAWLAFKLEQAYALAAGQTDVRVAKALIDKYESYTLNTYNYAETLK